MDGKRVLLVNPWGIRNDGYYASGFISGMNNYVNLDYVSNAYYSEINPNGRLYRLFFRISEKMKESRIRKYVRGAEYVFAWKKILRLIEKNKYDVVHFHWLLLYPVDNYFLKRIKSRFPNVLLVLTAHNVLPHVSGEAYINQLRSLYDKFNYIIVHGNSIKGEFIEYFPEYISKLFVQHHGVYLGQNHDVIDSEGNKTIEKYNEKVSKYSKIFLMFGAHYYNKGTDRLIRIWHENFCNENACLVVVGKKDANYPELDAVVKGICACDNIMYENGYVADQVLNYMIQNSSIVVVPYRHASMSGVVFTAANFHKMVISTKVGAIPEYIEDGVDGMLCDADDDSLKEVILRALKCKKDDIESMGEKLNKNISTKCSWDNICGMVSSNIYCKEAAR